MKKGIVNPQIARLHKCKDCGHKFRPGYYEQLNVKCPKCASGNVRIVWFDMFLDIIKF